MKSATDHQEQPLEGSDLWPDEHTVQQEVIGVTNDMRETTDESTLSEKVETLLQNLHEISQEVHSWRGRDYYIETIDNLKQQVDSIHQEWNTVSEAMRTQRERLESLLQAFPGIIETSTLRALSMRVKHLEEMMTEIIDERQAKATSDRARKQLIISIIALVATVFFWCLFILMRFLPSG